MNIKTGKVVSVLLCAAATALHAAPRIECDAPEYNFGVRRDSETVVHQFTVKNAGDRPLVITRVKASCGCTAVKTSKDNILPGETASIEARFTLKDRRGAQRKSILVESNDPARPQIHLLLTGEIVTEVGIEPRYVNFSQIHTSRVATQSVALVSLRPDVRIVAVTSDDPSFAAEIAPDGRGLEIRTVPPLKEGFARARIEVKTNHPDGLGADVNIIGVVAGDLTVVPRDLILRASQPASRRVTLMVRPFEPFPFKVLSVEVPHPDVATSFAPLGNGAIAVTLDGLPDDPALNGKAVVIRTDRASSAELRVPIRVLP